MDVIKFLGVLWSKLKSTFTLGTTDVRVQHVPSDPLAYRHNFLKLVGSANSILEIGPFCNPALRGENVKYFEVLDQAALVERAIKLDYHIDKVPEVHYLSPIGDLSVVQDQFERCFSSHVIEHQPDLVRHLQQVERIVGPGGEYHLLIPDLRYCFDHFLTPSNIADVLRAYHEKKNIHDLKSVVEHRALITHNDSIRHWAGDHGEAPKIEDFAASIKSAMDEFEANAGGYIDVHAWQFTPETFKHIISTLNALGLIRFRPKHVFATPQGHQEFAVILVHQD